LVIIGGLCVIAAPSAVFIALVRAHQRQIERDLRRLVWPLVNALLDRRDSADADGDLPLRS